MLEMLQQLFVYITADTTQGVIYSNSTQTLHRDRHSFAECDPTTARKYGENYQPIKTPIIAYFGLGDSNTVGNHHYNNIIKYNYKWSKTSHR